MHVLSMVSLALGLPASVLLPSSIAHAGDDAVVPWQEVAFTTVAPAPYGRVHLILKVEADGRLSDVSLTREGASPLRIPAVAWADVTEAQIGQARTLFKTGFDGTPWLFVHIPFGPPISVRGRPEWTVLVIAFRADRAVYRALNIPKPGGGFDWRPVDLPRE
jgi:hypothetical protein